MYPVEPIVPGISLPVTHIAKDQTEYLTLPAYITPAGEVITRWNLSFVERLRILYTGSLWLTILTFNKPLQLIRMSTESPVVESL